MHASFEKGVSSGGMSPLLILINPGIINVCEEIQIIAALVGFLGDPGRAITILDTYVSVLAQGYNRFIAYRMKEFQEVFVVGFCKGGDLSTTTASTHKTHERDE